MDHAEAALRLMLTRDEDEAESLAAHLSEQNERRRQQERETLAQARAMVEAEVTLDADKVIVLASEGWHPGVIGIVASRLVEIYHRPVLLVAIIDGIGKGSGRSVGGLDLWKALTRCDALLTHFGGHEYAAGFGMMPEDLGALREQINQVADEYLSADDLVRHVTIDLAAEFRDLTPEALSDLNRLAPFGVGNPTPVLVTHGARVEKAENVGREGSHLSLWLAGGDGRRMGAIWFGGAEAGGKLQTGASVHVCYKPRLDEWQGRARVRLHVEDIALASDPDEDARG
jgi:single-stranded-DNA-specific exonuclease